MSRQLGHCPLCDEPEKVPLFPRGEPVTTVLVTCSRCGDFNISYEAYNSPTKLGDKRYLLSALTRESKELGYETPSISASNVEEILAGRVPQSVNDRANHLLYRISRKARYPGDGVKLDPNVDYPLAYCKGRHEFLFYYTSLKERGLLQPGTDGEGFTPSVAGWDHLAMKPALSQRTKAFVAMWFVDDLKPAYLQAIEPAIEACGYVPRRVDRWEHVEKIDDLIISEIRESRFLVADFTGDRGGVYFEAGFAFGLGIPVIWMCKSGHEKDMHFDTRQYNHIIWENPVDLRDKLEKRIGAIIGKRSAPDV